MVVEKEKQVEEDIRLPPWGKLTKGTKTRSVKEVNPLIIQKENNMNRSKWKGPFTDHYLVKKIETASMT